MRGIKMDSQNLFREMVCSIADTLIDDMIELPEGPGGWINHRDEQSGRLIVAASDGLYAGQLGIGLTIGMAGKALEESAYCTIAQSIGEFYAKASKEACSSDASIGGIDGIGSQAWALYKLGELFDEESFISAGSRLLQQISRSEIREMHRYDFIGGAAGLIPVFLEAASLSRKSLFIDRALLCGERLMEGSLEFGTKEAAWRTTEKHPVTGFGHGNAGIAYSLFRLADSTERYDFRELARNAIRYENRFYEPARKNWRDTREGSTFTDGWCYGVSGIGLGRLRSIDHSSWSQLSTDVERALGYEVKSLQSNDALCHGTLSRIAWLSTAGEKLTRSSLIEVAASELEEVISRKEVAGHFQFQNANYESLSPPSIFVGRAGVLYMCLRFLLKDSCPDLLTLT